MKHRLAVLSVLMLLSPSLGAQDSAPKLIRERIEQVAKFIAEALSVGGRGTAPSPIGTSEAKKAP